MLVELAELALRATGLGCIVWLGLKLTRVRDPRLEMSVWTMVLLVALAMPVLEPWMQVTLPARLIPTRAQPVLSLLPAQDEVPFFEALSPAPQVTAPPSGRMQGGSTEPATAPSRSVDWLWWASVAYLLVAGALMLRLVIGIAVMCRITAAARPVGNGGLRRTNVRLTSVVRVPVTFASFVLLPVSSSGWSDHKRRIVLLHEGVHVARGDFYRLLLASLYRAAFWFSPFAWWLQHCLADLAETVTDDAVVTEIGDRRGYADLLLEMAGAAPRPPSGIAMAHVDGVPRRVRRILSMRVPPAAISRPKRLVAATAVLLLSAISAGSVSFDIGARAIAPQQFPLEGPHADMPAGSLDRLVGDYQIGVGSLLTIGREGHQLGARLIGEPMTSLRAVSDHEFISEPGGEKLTFTAGSDGRIAGVELRGAAGRIERGTRIDAGLARLIENRFVQRVTAAPDRFVGQVAAAGGSDRLGEIIAGLQRGAPDYASMSPQLANQMRVRASLLHDALSKLGEVRSMSFQGVGPGGYDIYAVGFANGSAEFRLDLAEHGTLDDLIFHPEGDGRPGEILDCARQATLKPAADIAPIRVSLINRSGADVRLLRLGASRQWLAGGSLEDGFSTDILTDVARPLMIADPQGQCRQIILPGRSTRVHVIASQRPGASQQIDRDLPANGSYEALQDYIAGVRSGELKEDLLTPQAAAASRPLQKQRQAILTRLGQQLVVSFRGVTAAGSDIYHVRFANGAADWQIAVTENGRISSVSLLP